MNLPMLIPVTLSRTGTKIFINASFIERVLPPNPDDEDEDNFGTCIVLFGHPSVRVKESPEEIKELTKNTAKNFIVETVRTLHGYGYIK